MHKPAGNTYKKVSVLKSVSRRSTDDLLHRLAFDNSLLANIITTVSTGRLIIANHAACKLFGYSMTEILTLTREDIFDTQKSSFKRMLKQRTAEGHSTALITGIKQDGTVIPCEITSAVFIDEKGVEKAITTIADMSQSILNQQNIDIEKGKIVAGNIEAAKIKSDTRLADNNEWIKYIAKTSYDVMWDWDISTGDIYVGDSVEEVFGYKVNNNTINFKSLGKCLRKEEKAVVKKLLRKTLNSGAMNWNDSFMFTRYDGSVASTTSRASIIRNDDGKAIRLIGAMQDVSRLQELENKLENQIGQQKPGSAQKGATVANNSPDVLKQKKNSSSKQKKTASNNAKDEGAGVGYGHGENFNQEVKFSFDGIWDWDLLTNDYFSADGFQELSDDIIQKSTSNMDEWSRYLHPDDKEIVEKKLIHTITSSAIRWEQACRFIRFDGSVARILGRASIIRDTGGRAYRIIGVLHDLSRHRELEERLEHEIKLKDQQIAEATEDAKDNERSDIGKELHDNVNQLLGASRLYLDMAKRGGKDREMYLSRSSEYTLSAIEEIRKLTKGLTTDVIKNLGLRAAIEKLIQDTMETNPLKISCVLDHFTEDNTDDKFKLNIFRIVQEQLNNILKHAKAKKVVIRISQNKNATTLIISDDGIGFDTSKKQKGIGLANIKSRAVTYKGTAGFVSQPGEGCILTVSFPVTGE